MGSQGQEISKEFNTPTSVAELNEGDKKSSCVPGLASLNLLNKRQRGTALVKWKMLKEQGREEKSKPTDGLELSTVEIIKLAKEAFLRLPTKSYGDLPMVINPVVEGPSTLSEEDIKNVELVLWLLASADKFGNKQFDRAMKFLRMCDDLSPLIGSPLERAVYYFAGAIREKIISEAAQISGEEGIIRKNGTFYVEEAVKELQPAVIACQQELPFIRIAQFTGIQAVLDKVSFAKRIHFIDFGIRMGANAIVLMQALAVRHERPIDLLKITAVATTLEHVGDAGKRLSAFADTIGLPFIFKAVVIPDMKDLT